MDDKLLPVKSDFVFKLIFGDQRNADILADFLKSVLDIPAEEYESITIVDPYVKKEFKTDKYGIFDVKIHTKSGNVIQVEIQVEDIADMKKRVLYGQSKMVTEQIKSGNDWEVIDKVISIIITDYVFIEDSEKYHHKFRYRTEDGVEFTNLAEINTLELAKLPKDTDSSELWYWMKFIKSEKGEGLDMLAERNPQIRKAVGVLKELSADERTRMIYEDREKARRDIAAKMKLAKLEGKHGKAVEVARNLLKMGMTIETIIQATGLTNNEISSL
jgi:predicted transposase/invertase (TIGR01784 family)